MSFKNKIVIVVSAGNSGGGAIHDYLLCRNDFVSPFQGEEFRLITDPYGLENLYHKLIKNFSRSCPGKSPEKSLHKNTDGECSGYPTYHTPQTKQGTGTSSDNIIVHVMCVYTMP